ncbi:MAG: DedA family protein, partial [Planctomycetia bacterium]|nr:DedA family protein [Planctomycetia bacterium]
MPFPAEQPAADPIERSADAIASPTEPVRPRGSLRRLYDWVLSWADSPHGTTALAVISFAESSFFPIPPDVLQIALSVGQPRRSFRFAAVSAVASVLGAIVGWLIGWGVWQSVSGFFYEMVPGFTPAKFQYVESLYQQNAGLYLVLSAFTPIPFKIFTIAAGVCSVPLLTLVLASAVGRSGRFFLVATIMRLFGKPARDLLDKYLELATLLLGA